jgi:arginine decarboxylase
VDATEFDQGAAPLVEALRAYRERHTVAFHTPGHKLGAGAPADLIDALGERFLAADMGIANGLDDTQESGGLLRHAEDLAAAAWGARRSFFVPNGSSGGLQALVMAVAGPGEQVIVPRNAHKSLLAGLILSGATPIFVEPTVDETWQVAVNTPLSRYVAALEAHSGARALFVTSPSYNGFCADVPGLATLAHAAGLPLVVDQAWGAHLRFAEALPIDAMAAGADAAVISVHKLLSGLSQAAAVLAAGGDRLDVERLRTMVTMLRTTSPLAPIYVSIDAARRQMVEHGEALWGEALRLAALARRRLAAIPGVAVLDWSGAAGYTGQVDAVRVAAAQRLTARAGEARGGAAQTDATRFDTGQAGAVDFDPARLTISAAGLGLSGYELERALRAGQAVAIEATDPHNIVANITFGDSEASIERLVLALASVVARAAASGKKAATQSPPKLPLAGRQALSPREAFFGASEVLPLAACAGRVSAEMVVPYPPGIPVLGPGEEITSETVEYLREAAATGILIHGPRDLSLQSLQVVAGGLA